MTALRDTEGWYDDRLMADWSHGKWAGLIALLLAVFSSAYLLFSGFSLPPQSEVRDCKACPVIVLVPAGNFVMGSPAYERNRRNTEGPQHQVTVPADMWVAKYEVTMAEWDGCVADDGCGGYVPSDNGWGRDNRPVINVSWADAQAYVAWLSRKTGKPYRLLSEAEWEYAARGGVLTPYYWGQTEDGTYARYGSQKGTAPVGSYRPNAFGLSDMLGNVWEWTEDCYNATYDGAPESGDAWRSGDCSARVLRGGAWSSEGKDIRSANRFSSPSGARNQAFGFRVARTR